MKSEEFKTQPDSQAVGGQEKQIVHPLERENKKMNWREILLPAVIIIVIILFGAASGYFLAGRQTTGGSKVAKKGGLLGGKKSEMGFKDETLFPDKAEGKLEVNESQEILEGSHQLVRSGGPSQTAYLTSSAVDLDEFVGRCVEVWGETFSAQKAAWLMDIGYIKEIDQCPEGV